MRLSLLVWLGLLLVASRVVAETPSVRVLEPRAFGYFIGDVVAREVSIMTDVDQTIDPASIPRPGPLNYWLNLKSVELEENVRQAQRHYTMRLEYQTFYAPLDLSETRNLVPALEAASRARTVEVAADIRPYPAAAALFLLILLTALLPVIERLRTYRM